MPGISLMNVAFPLQPTWAAIFLLSDLRASFFIASPPPCSSYYLITASTFTRP